MNYSALVLLYGAAIGLAGFLFLGRCWRLGRLPRKYGKALLRSEEPLAFQFSIYFGLIICSLIFWMCGKLFLESLSAGL